MKISTFGAIAVSAVAALTGSMALAQAQGDPSEPKACYRPHCGKSIKGHEGKCGGTVVEELSTEATCKAAGGAWVTAAVAKKFEKS